MPDITDGGCRDRGGPGRGRGYSPDTVSPIAVVGQAVPSGVVCYRHYQFPVVFRNGLFVGDWSSGRIYFTSLVPTNSSYEASPEVFLEPIGMSGLCAGGPGGGPDGALLVAARGARTRGAIYRIDFPPGIAEVTAMDWLNLISAQAHYVLNAPQPLDAWARDI